MSILAGLFSRSENNSLQDTTVESIKRLLSRNQEDKVTVFRNARCFLAKVDINAYGEPAFHIDPSGTVSMLAGEPLLNADDGVTMRTRTEDLEFLHQSWNRGDWSLLGKTRGVFCAVHYESMPGRLHLITDKLGVRPLYYWTSDKYVIFSSALRVLEGLDEIPKCMDLRGVTEMTCFGYPLGDRTPYTHIIRLKSGEIVEFLKKDVTRMSYWRMDLVQPLLDSEGDLMKKAYEKFVTSVAIRLRTDTSTVACLSGGLDSRCIVTVLRSRNVNTQTFNYSPENTQDKVFAAEFARQVGSLHYEENHVNREEEGALTAALAEALAGLTSLHTCPPERPRMVWSGDGGSVGVGHVYMSQQLVELLRAGRFDQAIGLYLKEQGIAVLTKLLKPNIAHALTRIPYEGIREELQQISCDDPGRAFHLFLMLNDQRRHLSEFYEDIDLRRVEFQLPFFDADFLQCILASPIDLCLGHKFYTRWLSQFPPVVKSVPWQVYPSHEPCPIPVPRELVYQWDPAFGAELRKSRKRKLLQQADEMLRSGDFPSSILNRNRIRIATFLQRTGFGDYSYLIRVARTYYKYLARYGGKYSMPQAGGFV